MKKIICLLFLFYSINTLAKDLGVFGEVFPVEEQNLINVIKGQLSEMEKNGGLDEINKNMQLKAKDKLNHPNAVLTTKTDTTKERLFDPTITLTKDLKDDKGVVFARQGTKVNPLNYMSFDKTLYFLDSDDKEQVNWLLKQKLRLNDKVILTNGSPLELEKILNRKIYFDQNGELIKRFKISVVPSIVMRKDDRFLIQEISIDE